MKYTNFNPYNINFSDAVQRISARSAADDKAIGYYLPALIDTPLPHSKPEPGNYRRYNGDSVMKLVPDDDFGLPHSGRSRLLITWMISNLYKNYNIGLKSGIERNQLNKESRLIFKGTMKEMLQELGYEGHTGGENGSITQVKKHLLAIINTQYKWPKNEELENLFSNRDRFLFTMNDHIDWRTNKWETAQSYIEISPTLLHLIVSKTNGFRPMPIDLRALSSLRESPMAMDLYCWLTKKMGGILKSPNRHKCFTCTTKAHPFTIPWSALHPQFGDDYKRQIDFANRAKDQIEKIKLLWKDRSYTDSNGITYKGLNVRFPRGRILLDPSPSHVSFDIPKAQFYEVINA